VSRYVFRLPDLGEGTVEAEIVAWRVRAGEEIAADAPLVEMMTEKATVEVPSPVAGRVLSVTGAPGDRIAVGRELAVFETAEAGAGTHAAPAPAAPASIRAPAQAAKAPAPARALPAGPESPSVIAPHAPAASDTARVMTSPAIRRRAREAGVDLRELAGSGPGGRIVRADFDRHLQQRTAPGGAAAAARAAVAASAAPADAIEEVRVIGIRRVIAERMEAARRIPHFSYVEEVDVTALESLRGELNARRGTGAGALTYLPFLVLGLVRALAEHPQINALYDAERGVLIRHRAVHVGIATQSAEGLKVPVLRDAQSMPLETIAAEIRRLTEAARTNRATRAELGGSTITLTSLGRLGGIVSTPILNAPELAIVGVNRAVERPVVLGGAVVVRRMMNLSSSFDHRFIDGHDAAAFIQALKARLEQPALLFMH